jgi:hypothetical protein
MLLASNGVHGDCNNQYLKYQRKAVSGTPSIKGNIEFSDPSIKISIILIILSKESWLDYFCID